ncbi:hypothetical protein FRB99_003767 [Tulasnella sp. 403]|nr:hypothetical protein FRB99_003767 [Tulasnella sp. 403]
MEILRPPPPSPAIAPKLPPLTLGTRSLIEEHTPTTLHSSVLPPELACKLFYKMLDEAEAHWRRSKWYVVDKLVESPHLTSFYVRGEQSSEWHKAARHWYNGFAAPTPPTFPAELEEACLYVEKVVNSALAKRKRYPMEWGGDGGWRANVAAANRYKGGKEGVGFHSDGMTYLGPYCTIASLSLGTERIFRLRETISKDEKNAHAAQTYNISLPHNSLIIMHASCQEHFKHSIPIIPSTGIDIFKPSFPRDDKTPIAAHTERINVTFRFFRPDFAPETIPKCKCDVPMVLRANQKGSGRLAVESGAEMRYFWMCYGGAHNEGKGCGQLKVLDMKAEGRGPFYGETEEA